MHILLTIFRVPEDEWTIIDDYYDDYVSEEEMEDFSTKPVPIWLSIFLVIGYIVGGAFLFQVQLRAKQTAPLVNKHYENEVTLR